MKFKKEMGSSFIEQDNDIYIALRITKSERKKEVKEIEALEKEEGIEHKDYSFEKLRERLNKIGMRSDG